VSALLALGIATMGIATMGVAAAALAAESDDAPPPIRTVFLVCDGTFTLRSDSVPDAPPDRFDGAIYLSITQQGDNFTQVKLQPFEGSERLRSQLFAPTPAAVAPAPQSDALQANVPGVAPPFHTVSIAASNDELTLTERRESGVHVKARIDDQPLVQTRAVVDTVEMNLNRFSGRMRLIWGARRVHDVRPAGAIRATKVSYLDSKLFEATCHTMQERLF